MKIGIAVFSGAGHTLAVAQQLSLRLKEKGHEASLLRITADNERSMKNMKLKNIPDITPFDAVYFACPVWGFGLCFVMDAYLKQLPDLKGKKTGAFVTMLAPVAWMGGTKAVKKMRAALEEKGAELTKSAILGRTKRNYDSLVQAAVENLSIL